MEKRSWNIEKLYILTILTSFMVFSCDMNEADPVQPIIVVEGYLIGGSPFDGLILRRTFAAGERLPRACLGDCPERFPISGATVELSSDVDAKVLVEDSLSPGKYKMVIGDTLNIQHNKTYRLRVISLQNILTSETSIPSKTTTNVIAPTGSIKSSGLEIRLKMNKDATVSGYLVTTLIDYGQPINTRYSGNNYFITSDSAFSVPWTVFATLGNTKLYIYAFDKNYFDYVKTRKVGNPTQTLFEPSSSIRGGLGIFGSASIDSVNLVIEQ